MTIIVSGNPIDGFVFTGLFEDGDKAIAWAETNMSSEDWWVAVLEEAKP